MKKSDLVEETVETWTECPYCFQNVIFHDDKHHYEDETVTCPKCDNDFRLGEIQ